MTVLAAVNVEALVIFGIVLAITLGITYWASKRASSAVGFYAAGRQITGVQNGLAISGDYLSAASFLGIAGLIFLFGFDGFLYSIGFLVAFLTVMFLLAERMRNSGKYTIADVLAFRLRERPARSLPPRSGPRIVNRPRSRAVWMSSSAIVGTSVPSARSASSWSRPASMRVSSSWVSRSALCSTRAWARDPAMS